MNLTAALWRSSSLCRSADIPVAAAAVVAGASVAVDASEDDDALELLLALMARWTLWKTRIQHLTYFAT